MKVKVLGVLILPAAMVLALAYVETRVVADSPSSYPRARGVVWAGRTFVDRAQLARWLRSRGVRYRVWAARHPALTGITPRQDDRAARRAEANGADHRSPWLVGAAAVLVVLLLLLVSRGRRLVRWLGRILSSFPRPPSPRGVVFRHWSRRPLGVAAGLGLAPVRPVRRWQLRVRTGLPTARRYAVHTSAEAARTAGLILQMRAVAGLLFSTRASAAAFTFRRRRSQLAWCLATVLLAAGTGLLVTAWLNGA